MENDRRPLTRVEKLIVAGAAVATLAVTSAITLSGQEPTAAPAAPPTYVVQTTRPAPTTTASVPTATSPPTSDETTVDVDIDRDGNLRDGRLTGGYCRHKWWC